MQLETGCSEADQLGSPLLASGQACFQRAWKQVDPWEGFIKGAWSPLDFVGGVSGGLPNRSPPDKPTSES